MGKGYSTLKTRRLTDPARPGSGPKRIVSSTSMTFGLSPRGKSRERSKTMTRQLGQILGRMGATALIAGSVSIFAAYGQQMPAEYDQAMKTLGKQGDFNDNVLKIN